MKYILLITMFIGALAQAQTITVDKNIENATNWDKKTGANIGGVNPDSYAFVQSPGFIEFYETGNAYSDWLSGSARPLEPTTGTLTLSFEVNLDSMAEVYAQALEYDTKLSVGGWMYNFSSQINYNEGGMFQVTVNGKHVDTGFKTGFLPAREWVPVSLTYKFNTNTHTFSFDTIAVGGVLYTMPSNFRNLQATNQGWTDGAYLQVQEDLNHLNGGAFSEALRNIQYTWQ